MSKNSHHFLTLWPRPLTYDLEKLIRSGHYHYQCVYQIWEQSIPWFLSYRVNTIAGGGRLRRKTITSPDPSDTGDLISDIIHNISITKLSFITECMITIVLMYMSIYIRNNNKNKTSQKVTLKALCYCLYRGISFNYHLTVLWDTSLLCIHTWQDPSVPQ